ncbi:17385_t:CDS:1, partial [Funneliformis geosporum]
ALSVDSLICFFGKWSGNNNNGESLDNNGDISIESLSSFCFLGELITADSTLFLQLGLRHNGLVSIELLIQLQ